MFENAEFLHELFVSENQNQSGQQRDCCELSEKGWGRARELLSTDEQSNENDRHVALLGYN